MKKLSGFLIVLLFALVTVAAWGYANRPTSEPALPRVIHGFAFQPYQKDQDAIAGEDPTVEQIDADLKLLSGTTRAVRTYSAIGTLGEIPALARKHGLKVMLGSLDRLGSRAERPRSRSGDPARQDANATSRASSSATKSSSVATCRSRI